jgi:ELWxxDGT repeat protein
MDEGGVNQVAAVGDTLFFLAPTTNNGKHLWRTDGTEAGTVQLTSGTSDFPHTLSTAGGYAYYTQKDTGTGKTQLFRIGPTDAVNTQSRISGEAVGDTYELYSLTPFSTKIFSIGNYIPNVGVDSWGVILVHDTTTNTVAPVSGSPTSCSQLVAASTRVYVACGSNIVSTTGSSITSLSTGLSNIQSIYPTSSDSIFIWANSGGFDNLYYSDGSTVSAALTNFTSSNINVVSNRYISGNFYFIVSEFVYTVTTGPSYTFSLWKSNGTAQGTSLIKTLLANSPLYQSPQIATDGTNLYTIITTSTGNSALWRSDGTTTGTAAVANYYTRFGSIGNFMFINGNLVWQAVDAATGYRRMFQYNASALYGFGDYGHGFSTVTPLSDPTIGTSEQLTVAP